MSRVSLYQLYDLVNEQIVGPIMTSPRDEGAIRSFYHLLENGTDPGIKEYPSDFALLKLGSQDITNGQLEAHLPLTVTDGKTWLEQKERAAAIAAARGASSSPQQPRRGDEPAPLSHIPTDDELRRRYQELMPQARQPNDEELEQLRRRYLELQHRNTV